MLRGRKEFERSRKTGKRSFRKDPSRLIYRRTINITLIAVLFILTDLKAQQQYQPLRYYTFDGPTVGHDQMNNSDLDFQYYGSGYSVDQNGPTNQYLTMGQSGSLVKGGVLICQNELTVEFLFKPGHNFNNTEFIRRRDKAFEISFDLPDPSRLFARIKFKTQYKDNSGNHVDDNMAIDLDGIGVKSWGYYTDGNWHHLVYKFNGNTGTKEIWVDGQLASGFSKSVPPGKMQQLGQLEELWFNNITNYRRLFGSVDEIAIYNSAIPPALIYKHYLEFQQGNHFTWTDDYTGNIPSADPVTAGIDINEYAPGHPIVNVGAITQLRNFPTPRFKDGHTLIRNFQWFDPGKLAGFQTSNNSWTQIRHNVIAIQKELAKRYHYFLLVSGNTIDNNQYNDTLSLPGASVKIANENPQWPTSAITFWPQIDPTHAGFSYNKAYIKSQNLPANYYLRNSSGQFMSQWGGNTSTKFWSPAAPRNYNQYDGQTQRFYVQKLLTALTRPLDIINENAEVLPLYPESTLQQDPAVVADKNASGLDWTKYQGFAKARASIAYRNEFMSLNGLQNTIFTEYGIDGQPQWRHDYSEARKINSQINGQYYSTPDFYTRWPSNWRYWAAAWHGWQWIVDSRVNELGVGDKLYSPFVSAGWNNDPESNVRPAQWLGLLKALAITGAEFYYTGFFAETQPYQNPDNWVWQVVMPPLAQAVTSRYEDLLRNGHLMDGDVPAYNEQTNSKPGYSFYTGDYSKLVCARKHNNANKYAITGSIQPNNNMMGSVEQSSDVKINLDGQDLQFNIRRQGSTYYYDNTNPSDPVFYQLDGWHEYKHPSHWTKDFSFEAELFDNNSANFEIKTEVPVNAAPGDFRNYTSFLQFNNVGTAPAAEYNFTIRDAGQTFYLWVRARSADGSSTGIDVELDNNGVKSIGCIDSTDWAWYRYDACNQQAISYSNTAKNEHVIKFLPLNDKIQIDQILLTTNSNLVLNPQAPNCSATNASISTSGSTTFCSGDSVSLTASAGTSYLWYPSGDTTRTITVKTAGTYSVIVGQGTGCSANAPSETITVISSVNASITPGGSTTICQGDSVTLTASAASAYSWLPNGETTQSITVTAAGSYSVNVTDSNGCEGSSSPIVISTYNNNGAQITANGPVNFCAGNSVTLTAPTGATYQWSNGATTRSITVSNSGNYAVDLIYGSGCA
ncbi:MAG: hypothetical protein HKN22_01110, partial [Bacteroidia bacterium]|nr:hypothetical protein [Bacteroidia bacterium]